MKKANPRIKIFIAILAEGEVASQKYANIL
jgi:hypothetical protein